MQLIIAFVSLAVGVVGAVLGYRSVHRRSHLEWQRIVDEVDNMFNALKKHSFEFDYIVSWPNGGLIAADLLQTRHADRVPVLSLAVKRSRVAGKAVVEVAMPGNTTDFKGKSFVIVDDVIATGRTMEAALSYLESCGVERDHIYTAVLGIPEDIAAFIPDYHGFKYSGVMQLPWGTVPRDRTGP